MFLHVTALIIIVAVLFAMGPRIPARLAFVEFENLGGWRTTGLALCIGQISALFGLMCSDARAHISEEIQDASTSVPRSMFWSFVINSSLGLLLIIAYLFAMPSVDDAVNDPSGFPFLYVFQQAMATSGTNAVTTILLFILFWSNIAFNASTARQTWSFARDKGLPFSR
jgi:amino acid transporter